MKIPNLPGPSAYDSDFDVDAVLEKHDEYIVALARKKIPPTVASSEVLDLEIDELAQMARIKLWLALQKQQIRYPKSYIRCIVQTETVNMLRQHKPILSLLTDEDGEFNQGNLLAIPSEGTQDPLYELEREEMIADYIAKVVDDVLKLPACQQFAMICSLKDQLDDVLLLIEAFKDRQVEIEEVNWPEEKEEIQRIRASLSVARKKLRSLKKSKDVPE
jgi:DNA-directed RNA polymerase specialized sigma24 family protein